MLNYYNVHNILHACTLSIIQWPSKKKEDRIETPKINTYSCTLQTLWMVGSTSAVVHSLQCMFTIKTNTSMYMYYLHLHHREYMYKHIHVLQKKSLGAPRMA